MKYAPIITSIILIVVCLFGFYEIADDVKTSAAVARFDTFFTDKIQALRSPGLDVFMKLMTYAGGIIGVSVLTIVLWLVLRNLGRTDDANFSFVAIAGGSLLANVLKHFLKRVRPESTGALIALPHSSSFPSGHSMGSMCLALATMEAIIVAPTPSLLIKAATCAGCVLYALLVGVSRVYLGVHYPSDVIAAWLLSGAWISAATALNRIFSIGRFQIKQR